jgi:glycosyltransferase involved in cell wall biosynthesis
MLRIGGAMSPDISVVLCTWNRAALLGDALAALLAQHDPPTFEILVVDNASTDDTRAVVERHAATDPRIRYVREHRQGLSYARNTGIALSRGSIVAFTDDDVRVGADWLRALRAAFERHPDAACIGGPVRPVWPTADVPRWLTERHWAPLGVQDYGAHELRVDASLPLCLIGANLAFRREPLQAIGGFALNVQRVADAPGSTEDHECHIRLWQAGRFGVYDPLVQVRALVESTRVGKAHHRRWHFGHGRHIARMRLADIEESRFKLFGAPAHLLRQASRDLRDWIRLALRHDAAGAFEREVRLWFTAGFLRERWG